ncbi:MAG TPA: ribosome biogenesis GTP-binding protein YihA/YsxC [Chlamydiales bacterium]|nr:ribosome biogenesis GTP-binding protein YihA/YsxC [Chlamydiales bacterium]
MRFEQAIFITSALLPTEFPKRKLPEIALAGRSNVGKSSLINTLFQTKKTAKTSSTPGKTQRINFFLVDDSSFLVDLPGYGYAAAPDEEILKWSQAIDDYLNQSQMLRLILLLIDIRREPSKEDLALAEWASLKQIPVLVVFTKQDKLSEIEGKKSIEKSLSLLPKVADALSISNRNVQQRRHLIQKINTLLNREIKQGLA